MVTEAFYETLKGSITDEIISLLPKTPVAIKWQDLSEEKQEGLKKLYLEDNRKGVTGKTIRKHIRKYLEDIIAKKKKKKKK